MWPAGRGGWAGGWSGLFNTYYFIDRTAGLASTVLFQLLPFRDPGALGSWEAVRKAVHG